MSLVKTNYVLLDFYKLKKFLDVRLSISLMILTLKGCTATIARK